MIRKSLTIGGRELSIETGRMAKQASGAVVVRYGDTMVLVTAVANYLSKVEQDFLPLQVEYRERGYAAGKIPGGFYKREGRPTEKEVLSSRLIDRPIRPLFPENYFFDTQIIANVISSDQENSGDILGVIGASAALCISDIPFLGPIAAVRIGYIENQFVLNPTIPQLENSKMDFVIAGTEDSIVMVEGEAKEIPEELFIQALEFAREPITAIIGLQKELIEEIKPVKITLPVPEEPAQLRELILAEIEPKLEEWRQLARVSKKARNESINTFLEQLIQKYAEQFPNSGNFITKVLNECLKQDMRQYIMSQGIRLDGRTPTEIRPITCEIGVLPRAHGSALFTRGETQSLGSVTLGTKFDEQIIDDIEQEEYTKRFMLHYNFPPFSVGEVKPLKGAGRREIGHGNLAERALKFQIPPEEVFPYTIRIVSDILESNGSSSMATVCAGSLAMMDAGIPIQKTVAGIAMGLIKEEEKVVILSDIIGAEDHYGDMDLKVAGTRDGITAVQMDLKVKGISTDILRAALEQARQGRFQIIEIMEKTIDKPRPDISPYAPRMITIKIDTDMIGDVIGPGGKNIRAIQAETGAKVEIDETGLVFISGDNYEATEKAKEIIAKLTTKPEEGAVYRNCPVKRLESYGAFVEFLPGKEGLLHISEVAWKRTNDITDVLKVGDKVDVLLKKIPSPGRFELSMKELTEKPDGYDDRKQLKGKPQQRPQRPQQRPQQKPKRY